MHGENEIATEQQTGQAAVAAVGIIILVLILSLVLSGCKKEAPLPAKTLEGKWTLHSAVYFRNQTDSCTGTYAIYDSTSVDMIWDISYFMDNLVEIAVTGNGIPDTIRVDTACTHAHNYSFPMTLRGVVGAGLMVVEKPFQMADTSGVIHTAYQQLGKFYFSGNSLTGDFKYLECDTLHCRGYSTRAGAIAFRRD